MNFPSIFEDFLIKSENFPNFFPRRLEKNSVRWIFLKKNPFHRALSHCFSSNLDFAKKLIAHGIKISFSGNITFKNATNTEVVEKISLDDLSFVETHKDVLNFKKIIKDRAKVLTKLEKPRALRNLKKIIRTV